MNLLFYMLISCLIVAQQNVGAEKEGNKAESTNITAAAANSVWHDNEMDRLKRDLLANYDKYSKPSPKTVVNVDIASIFINLEERKGIFSVYVFLNLKWNDTKLVWDPSEYSNITMVPFTTHEIWDPEIVAFNSVDPSAETYTDTLILVYNSGSVLVVPPHQFNVFCDMDFSMWPYDRQLCTVKLGTWQSHDIQIQTRNDEKFDVDYFILNEWRVLNVHASPKKDPLTQMNYGEFTFEVERIASVYRAVAITPTACIILLILSTFWLPPQSGEKILLNGITALIILGFIFHLAQLLPPLNDKTPFIVLFLSYSFLLSGVSMLISITAIYLTGIDHEKRLPQWLQKLFSGRVASILCLPATNASRSSVGAEEDEPKLDDESSSQEPQMFELSAPSTPKKIIQNDWIMFATAIDRISFVIYCIVFAVLTFKYLI